MFTKVMTWLSISALLVAVFSHSSIRDLTMVGLVVCVGALIVLVRSVRMGKRYWTAGLSAIVVLFNPLLPLPVSPTVILGLNLACILIFIYSLSALQAPPRLSMPSITDRTPGSESL